MDELSVRHVSGALYAVAGSRRLLPTLSDGYLVIDLLLASWLPLAEEPSGNGLRPLVLTLCLLLLVGVCKGAVIDAL